MGLDIYFYSRSKENPKQEEKLLKSYNRVYFLVNWVSDNIMFVENCECITVSKGHVEILLEEINTLNEDNASEILPTMTGLRNSGNDYGKHYWRDVEKIKQFCQQLLDDFDFNKHSLIFEAWW